MQALTEVLLEALVLQRLPEADGAAGLQPPEGLPSRDGRAAGDLAALLTAHIELHALLGTTGASLPMSEPFHRGSFQEHLCLVSLF